MRPRLLLAGLLCLLPLMARSGHAEPSAAEGSAPAQSVDWLRVEINIPARELSLIEHGNVVAHYPVAIGQPRYRSIVMNDLITRIEWNPWWYPPDSPWAAGAAVTPPGPGNPLGRVKLPLSKGILLHGTNSERTIGRAASHGCFRMLNKDAVTLAWHLQSRFSDKTDPTLLEQYTKARRRTFVVPLTQSVPITIAYAPIVVREKTLYLYPDVYGKVRNWEEQIATALMAEGIDPTPLPKDRVKELRKQLRKGNVAITVKELFQAPVPIQPPVLSKADAKTTAQNGLRPRSALQRTSRWSHD